MSQYFLVYMHDENLVEEVRKKEKKAREEATGRIELAFRAKIDRDRYREVARKYSS